MQHYQAYPRDRESVQDLCNIHNAQRTLRRYHRKFHCAQQCILMQLKGIFLFFIF